MPNKNTSPHDSFFKQAFQHPQTAKGFLLRYLNKNTLAFLELNNIAVEPTEFIDEDLQKSASDIAFKLFTKQQEPAYIYILLEHQRKPDKNLPYRLLKYCIRLIDQHLAKYKTSNLPLIIPMILYNGDYPYPYSTSLWDLFDTATRQLAKDTFTESYSLIDLTQIDTREIKDDSWIAMALNALKYAPSKISPAEIIDILEISTLKLAETGELRYIQSVYKYLCETKDRYYRQELWQAFKQRLEPQLDEDVMISIADEIRQEGLEQGLIQGLKQGLHQGIHQGKLETARAMLLRDLKPEFIADITKLDIKEILAEAEKIAEASH